MRDYDPTTGRYIQADPLGLVDGASVYGYALQNPGRYTDPTGEFIPLVPIAFGAGIGVATGYLFDLYLGDGCYTSRELIFDGTIGAIFGFAGNAVRASKAAGRSPVIPDSYWIDKKSLTQTTPGTRTVNDLAKPSSSGGTYHKTTHYDEYGRQIGQTHRTTHGRPANHPNPHHHRRDPATGERLKAPNGSRTWPGLFGNQ